MTINQRVKEVVNLLIFQKYSKSAKDLAAKIGYNHTFLSQIVSGKVKVSRKFLEKLKEVDDNININWVLTGEGEMISKNETRIPNSEPATEVLVKNLLDMIERKDKTIIEMAKEIGELHNEVSILKKQGKTTNHLYAAEP